MTREDYLKMSKGLAAQVFFVADRAEEIIRNIMKDNADKNGYIEKDRLYSYAYEPDWIEVLDDRRVGCIYQECGQISIGVICEGCDDEEYDEYPLYALSPIDKIELADHLCRM